MAYGGGNKAKSQSAARKQWQSAAAISGEIWRNQWRNEAAARRRHGGKHVMAAALAANGGGKAATLAARKQTAHNQSCAYLALRSNIARARWHMAYGMPAGAQHIALLCLMARRRVAAAAIFAPWARISRHASCAITAARWATAARVAASAWHQRGAARNQ